MRRLSTTFALLLCMAAPFNYAHALEEIVVTARKTSIEVMPGSFLQRKADFLLLEVAVENDSRDADQRESEIYKTLKDLLAAADKNGDVEVSLISEGGIVTPMTKDNYKVKLGRGSRPDTSRTSISLKTRIPASEQDGQKLIDRLRNFLDAVERQGRTELTAVGEVEVSVVGPNQYRDEVIDVFAKDVKKVTGALDGSYKVVVEGIDEPVGFYRMGLLEIALYIPYRYMVLSETVNSYSVY